MRFEALRVRADPDVLWITVHRPESDNALSAGMMAEFEAALDEAERSPRCRMIVIQGGPRSFCTGLDLAAVSASDGGEGEDGEGPDGRREAAVHAKAQTGAEDFLHLLRRLTEIPRVVVARVEGRAVGGGVGLVAASDIVLAGERSSFGLPEALWGLLPCCVLPYLIRRTGFQSAYAMALSTLPVDAREAHRTGLADQLVAADGGEAAIRRLRGRIGRLDPATVGLLKAYARRMWFLTEETERAAVAQFTGLMTGSPARDRIAGFTTNGTLPWEERT